MQYAQINLDGTFHREIPSGINIEWDENNFCTAEALVKDGKAEEFRVVPLIETDPPAIDAITQTVYRDGGEFVGRQWQYKWKVEARSADEIAALQAAKEAELVKQYDGLVQGHLDAVARSFGYGDPNRPEVSPILHAISYAEEPAVERFMTEGRALRAWRSLVWVTAAGILNAVKAGDRAVPTEAELLAELPDPPTQDPL